MIYRFRFVQTKIPKSIQPESWGSKVRHRLQLGKKKKKKKNSLRTSNGNVSINVKLCTNEDHRI